MFGWYNGHSVGMVPGIVVCVQLYQEQVESYQFTFGSDTSRPQVKTMDSFLDLGRSPLEAFQFCQESLQEL